MKALRTTPALRYMIQKNKTRYMNTNPAIILRRVQTQKFLHSFPA